MQQKGLRTLRGKIFGRESASCRKAGIHRSGRRQAAENRSHANKASGRKDVPSSVAEFARIQRDSEFLRIQLRYVLICHSPKQLKNEHTRAAKSAESSDLCPDQLPGCKNASRTKNWPKRYCCPCLRRGIPAGNATWTKKQAEPAIGCKFPVLFG